MIFNRRLLDHRETEEKYGTKQVNGRLMKLGMAVRTVRNPREIWRHGRQTIYLQAFRNPEKSLGCAVFTEDGGAVRTYFPRSVKSLDKVRKGKRLK